MPARLVKTMQTETKRRWRRPSGVPTSTNVRRGCILSEYFESLLGVSARTLISGRSLTPHVNALADLDVYDVAFVWIHDTLNLRHAVRPAHV
jgi:hypothetical protein